MEDENIKIENKLIQPTESEVYYSSEGHPPDDEEIE